MLTLPKGSWQHPRVKAHLVVKGILTEELDVDQLRLLLPELPKLIAAREVVREHGRLKLTAY